MYSFSGFKRSSFVAKGNKLIASSAFILKQEKVWFRKQSVRSFWRVHACLLLLIAAGLWAVVSALGYWQF
ncbi:hypothetical protein ACSQ67_021579 [Phaseolus vulgaris]